MILSEHEVDDLIDCLRRNLLYQTPDIVMSENDETEPKAVVCRMRPDDYFLIFELIKRAGGWDLTEDQKKTLMRKSISEVSTALAAGDVSPDSLDSGTLMWIIEKTEHDPTYNQLHELAERELAARSGAN